MPSERKAYLIDAKDIVMHIMIFRHSCTSHKYHWKIKSTNTIYLPGGVLSWYIKLHYMYAMEKLSLEGCGAVSTLETKSAADMESIHQTMLILQSPKRPGHYPRLDLVYAPCICTVLSRTLSCMQNIWKNCCSGRNHWHCGSLVACIDPNGMDRITEASAICNMT